jgi:hypothetical protein
MFRTSFIIISWSGFECPTMFRTCRIFLARPLQDQIVVGDVLPVVNGARISPLLDFFGFADKVLRSLGLESAAQARSGARFCSQCVNLIDGSGASNFARSSHAVRLSIPANGYTRGA